MVVRALQIYDHVGLRIVVANSLNETAAVDVTTFKRLEINDAAAFYVNGFGADLGRDENENKRRRYSDHAAALSSLSAPRATILSASSASGRCNAFGSSHGARIQTSRSSSVVRITGIAFGWIGSTTTFGSVVRNP